MSTEVLNSNPATANTVSTVDNNGSSNTSSANNSSNTGQIGESTSSSLSASTSSTSNILTPPPQQQTSTSMMGAPTSVVVTVSTQQQQQQQQHAQQGPSTSSQSTSSLVAGPSSQPSYVGIINETPGTSSSSMQYLTETASYLHSMISQGQPQTSHHLMHQIQSSSSSSSPIASSSGSQSLATETGVVPQNIHHLIKRPFESSMDSKLLNADGSCSSLSSSKRSKISSSSMSPPPSKLLDADGLTMRQKLEQRLNGILCCAVCLDLPRSSVYQCSNGHLMCAGCFTHVLADARLRDESPTCPSCRVSISKESCSRNLAVEKAVSELPGECRFCQRELPRSMLEKHMTEICEERIVPCSFSNIGCPWNGPFHEAAYHANDCSHPNKSAREVLGHLENEERRRREQRRVHETLFTLLSYEKIAFHDIQFRPYRTDEYIHKLFYETSRFTAFNLQWVVKARVNDDQRDPTQSCQRHLSFQLCLKSKINNAMTIHYMLLKGPYGETKVLPMIYKFDFSESQTESNYNCINLVSTNADSNRLLAARMINFRLIMFQASK